MNISGSIYKVAVNKPEKKKAPIIEPVLKEKILEEPILEKIFDEEEDFLLIEEEDIEGEV